MIKNWIFYILLLLSVVFVYIFTNTYYTLAMLLLVVLLPVVSQVLMILSSRKVDIRFDLPLSMTKDASQFTCTIVNRSFIPVAKLAFDLVIENRLTGSLVTKKVYASVGSKKTCDVLLSIESICAGTISVRAERINVFDCFGLFALSKSSLHEQTALVYPTLTDIDIYMDRPVETRGEGNRYSPDKKGWDVSEILSIREYVAGDEIRKIHWKLSGKTDKFMVRDFSLPLNYSVFLIAEFCRASEVKIDTMAETFLGMSSALLENGINHNLAWYDTGSEQFYVRELGDVEDLEVASAEVLSSYTGYDHSVALDHYIESAYKNGSTILIYLTADPDQEKLAELGLTQNMRIIYIGDKGQATAMENIEVQTVVPGETLHAISA